MFFFFLQRNNFMEEYNLALIVEICVSETSKIYNSNIKKETKKTKINYHLKCTDQYYVIF